MSIDLEKADRSADPATEPGREETVEESVARGRSPATPFVMLGGVWLVVAATVVLVTLVVGLAWWLA